MEITQNTFARRKPEQLVYLELGSGNGGMLLSASEDGFRFRAVSPLRTGGLVPFSFTFDGTRRLEGVGQIEWLEEDAKSGGIRFTEVSQEFRSALSQWLASEPRYARSTREATPAAATPLDTMEKIRRDLRTGLTSPQQPTARSAKRSSEPERKLEPPVAAAPVALATEPLIALPQPAKDQEPAKPVIGNSAFLKAVREAPAEATPVSAPPSDASAPTAPALPSVVLPAPAAIELAAPTIVETAAERPHIPPPDESFEAAWERAQALANMERSPSRASRGVAGALIGLALAVILGALALNFRRDIGLFLIDLGEKIAGQNATGSAPTGAQSLTDSRGESNSSPATKPDAPSTDAVDKSNAGSPPAGNDSSTAASTSPVPDSGANPASGSAPATTKPETAAPAKSEPSAATKSAAKESAPAKDSAVSAVRGIEPPKPGEMGSGQQEFVAARELLRGSHRQKDLPKAVELLWSGVRKGYVPAEVTLADLYIRGDGVQKSCAQAQVLLVAASKKGSPDARQKLENLAEQGCR